tara:strand:+ start:1957 stop:2991 length:1035 start_codon:yes stop_codon:yes gene_type:complete
MATINSDTHFSIVPSDGSMTVDGKGMGGIDFSSANIPSEINALQWESGQGELEYLDARNNPNVIINDAPEWALKCLELFAAAVQAEVKPKNLKMRSLEAVDPTITEIMDKYPTINYEDANKLILTFSSNDFNLQIVSGTFMYDMETQETTPFRPIGVGFINLAGTGTKVGIQFKQLTEAGAKVGIPILSAPPSNRPDSAALREYNTQTLGQLAYDFVTADEIPKTLYYPEWSLAKDKIKKGRDIDTERSLELMVGFEYEGKMYDARRVSRTNLADYMSLVNAGVDLPEGFTWRAIDNTNTAFDKITLKDFANAMFTFMNDTYINSWNRKAALPNAKTIENVRAV